METVNRTFRLPSDINAEMKKMEINWSEVIRDAIRRTLNAAKKRSVFARLHQLTEGAAGAESGTAARIVREMRDQRTWPRE